MANFQASIDLNVSSTGAERQIKKLERSIERVEDKSREILATDKQIVTQRRILLALSGDQATRAKKRLSDLRLQRTELGLQKRELQAISKLEKQRVADLSRASGVSSSDGGGSVNAGALGAAALVGGRALSQQQVVQKSKALQSLEEFRDRQSDALDDILQDLEDKTRIFQQKLDRFNEVRAARPLLTKKGTFQPATNTSRNALFRARDDLFASRREAEFGKSRIGSTDQKIAALNDELERSGRAAEKARSPLAGLSKQVALTAAAYVGVDTVVRQFTLAIQKSTQLASSQQRIRALSEGFDNYADVVGVASQAAEKFNLSQLESQKAVAQLFGRLRPLGLTLEEVQTVFNGFNTAAALTGATSAESAGALLQLSQALGAGALRGEEFNSIAEQAPAVLQAIAKEVGKPVGQLKELAKQGELTSDIVIAALARVEREGADKLAASLDTPAQKFKTLQNRVEDLQIALGNLALPETIALLEGLTSAATNAATEVDKLALAKAGLKRKLDEANTAFFNVLNKVATLRDLFPVAERLTEAFAGAFDTLRDAVVRNIPGLTQIVLLLEAFNRLRGGLDDVAIDEQAARAAANRSGLESSGIPVWDGEKYVYDDPPKLKPLKDRLGIQVGDVVDPSIGQGKDFNDKALRDGIAAAEAADQANEDRRIALRDQNQLLERLKAQIRLQNSVTDLQRLENQLALDQLEIRQDINNKLEEAKGNPQLAEQIKREAVLRSRLAVDENTRPFFDAGQQLGTELAAEIGKVNDEVTKLDQLFASVGNTIETGIVDAITGGIDALVRGTEDLDRALQDIASGVLADISQQILSAAVSLGLRSLGGNDGVGVFSRLFPQREEGGPVSSGVSYLVGEKGPEIFTPDRSGTIIPNDAFTDAAGALRSSDSITPSEGEDSSEAFAQAAAALARNTTTITTNNTRQQESVFAESMMALSKSEPVNVRLNTVMINEMEFTTPEQTVQAVQSAVKQSKAEIFSDLKSKPSIRRQLGM